jgi:four helix bundle protein
VQSFRDLKVWTKAHALVLDVYRGTRDFPSDERFGLVAQMRRAASSVPANIAEGCARSSDADFIRFLHNAAGSANELEYFLSLAHDLNFIRDEDYALLGERVEEVKRMLGGLITRIKADG